MRNRKNENGNVLWLLLMAVALMAALTVTISRSTDTAEQAGNIERFRVQASDMMRFSGAVLQAVDNMRLRGVGENQLSFENSFTSASYTNANCLNTDCLVFGSAGGGMSYRVPIMGWLDSASSGDTNFGEWEFGGENDVPGIRSANPELIMYIGYLNEGLCQQINTLLDIAGIPADGDGIDTSAFQGSFAANDTIDNMDDIEAGCFEDNGASGRDFTYYQVLVKR